MSACTCMNFLPLSIASSEQEQGTRGCHQPCHLVGGTGCVAVAREHGLHLAARLEAIFDGQRRAREGERRHGLAIACIGDQQVAGSRLRADETLEAPFLDVDRQLRPHPIVERAPP